MKTQKRLIYQNKFNPMQLANVLVITTSYESAHTDINGKTSIVTDVLTETDFIIKDGTKQISGSVGETGNISFDCGHFPVEQLSNIQDLLNGDLEYWAEIASKETVLSQKSNHNQASCQDWKRDRNF